MATTRVLALGTAAALSLVLTGGTAHAQPTEPEPVPTTAAASAPSTGAPAQKETAAPSDAAGGSEAATRSEAAARSEAAEAAAAGMPTMPPVARSQGRTAASGVTITSYTLAQQRSFGFTFTGLETTDVVQIVWRTILNPVGVTHYNTYRGPRPERGFGYWDSGHQAGWTTATVTVLREGIPITRMELTNDKAVQVAAARDGEHFSVRLANTIPGDHMFLEWTLTDGRSGHYVGPASDVTQHVPGWSTATISVFEGTDRRALVAHPLTVSAPAPTANRR